MKNDELGTILEDLKECNNEAHTDITERLGTLETLVSKAGELCPFREKIQHGEDANESVHELAVAVNGKLDGIHSRITKNQVKLAATAGGASFFGASLVVVLDWLASRGGL